MGNAMLLRNTCSNPREIQNCHPTHSTKALRERSRQGLRLGRHLLASLLLAVCLGSVPRTNAGGFSVMANDMGLAGQAGWFLWNSDAASDSFLGTVYETQSN